MIDILLLAGKLALIALLYLFLAFAVTAGIGIVRPSGRSRKQGTFTLTITQGPSAIMGTVMPVTSSIVIGRTPGSDISVNDDFISGKHARIMPVIDGAILEDLDSTNGTILNGRRVTSPQMLVPGDKITIGTLVITVDVR